MSAVELIPPTVCRDQALLVWPLRFPLGIGMSTYTRSSKSAQSSTCFFVRRNQLLEPGAKKKTKNHRPHHDGHYLRRLYYHNNNDGTTNSRPQPSPLSWPTILRRQPLQKRHVHCCYWVDSEAVFIQLDAATPLMCPVATAQTIIPLDTAQVVSAPLRLLFCASAPLAMSKIEDSHCSWVNSEAIFHPTRSPYSTPCRRRWLLFHLHCK